jgi:ornithine cyclodeaminase
MKILSAEAFSDLINRHGFENYAKDLMEQLKDDFSHWHDFIMMPRPSIETPGGVIELMPIRNADYHAFKYVTCYPENPASGKQTVSAIGQLSSVETGYPLMISEMNFMTAFRTAATAALATDLLARKSGGGY